MERIIEKFSDQDLYSWSVGLFYLNHFSELVLEYTFVDRNNTVYPEGFAKRLMKEIWKLDGLNMTNEEIEGLKQFTSSYFPSWYYVFLQGLQLESAEVIFDQDDEGHLHGKIVGPAWRTVFWEQILLALISEMYHREKNELENYDPDAESSFTRSKALMLLEAGCNFVDMGTRRRFSKEHHVNVVKDLCLVQQETTGLEGNFIGTSNLWLAIEMKKKYPWIKCIGTMSHQMISVCAAIYGPREANKIAMQKWYESYKGNLGCYLPDCLGSDAFYLNFSREDAKVWDGYRIDSGDNMEEFQKLHDKLLQFRVDPKTIGCVFSNGLKIHDAVNIHRQVAGRMQDSYGLGTILTCGMADTTVKPSNIVIKATACRLTPSHPWIKCVKLSCDLGKATGDQKTIKAYKTLLGYDVEER